MAWSNYHWLWRLRGITHAEFRLLALLADEADKYGTVERLSLTRISSIIETSRRHVIRMLEELEAKDFCRRRKRHAPRKGKISNAYELNFDRVHPAETVGPQLWGQLVGEFGQLGAGLREQARYHGDRCRAFYRTRAGAGGKKDAAGGDLFGPADPAPQGTLYVWMDSSAGYDFFKQHRRDLARWARRYTPPVTYLYLIPPAHVPPKRRAPQDA